MESTKKKTNITTLMNKIEKLNRVTLILLAVIYIVVLIVVGTLINKDRNYSVNFNYQHRISSGSNEIHETQIIITASNSRSTVKENGVEVEKVETRYNISPSINSSSSGSSGEKELTKARIVLLGRTLNGLTGYIVQYGGVFQLDSSDRDYDSYLHGYSGGLPYAAAGGVTNTILNENGIKKIGGSVLYTNSNGVQKEYTFEEEMMQLTKSDLKKFKENVETKEFKVYMNVISKISTVPSINGYGLKLNLEINKDENGNLYKTGHVDIQSWFTDNNGNIYPFIGIYGYNGQDAKMSVARYSEYIRETMRARYIYIETRYYKFISAVESGTGKDEYQIIVERQKINYLTFIAEYEESVNQG